MKKSLYEPRKLTYDEHKKIDEFLRYFHENGKEVFELLRKSFGDYEVPVKNMAKAVNLLSGLHHFCENKSCCDRPKPMDIDSEEFNKWQKLYFHIGLWTTDGW